MVIRGLHIDRFKYNPEEKRFAVEWAQQNENGRTLAHLLDPYRGTRGAPPDPTNHELLVAATVVQWLGSPVGQSFLEQLGYERTDK